MNTPVRIINICAIFIIFFVLILGATWIGYRLEHTPNPLKEAVSSTASFLAILATLTAAYVASKLFNDWRVQHNKSVRNEFSLETYKKFSEFDHSLTLCAFDIESLEDSIADATYHITPGTPYYQDLLPKMEKVVNGLILVKINFSSYLQAQRAYGAVTGQSENVHKVIEYYINEHSRITNKPLKQFKNVQEFINNSGTEVKNFSDFSARIYNSNIREILNNLQVEDKTS
ncbi:hypothetical protein CDG62_09795 [Acinetobacter sp. WCHA55]|uniref:hypothetical protein n=1 Tax=Acinetobacter sp. WCHA55 TaxID=2004646 RepID=UPI000B3BDFD8|nr:hypothetical protein [Acinetobacter sp. WCHA55]AYA68610.1 hypothetical protein CDG62_09795 [Acinetobacter sp. WCHA55]